MAFTCLSIAPERSEVASSRERHMRALKEVHIHRGLEREQKNNGAATLFLSR